MVGRFDVADGPLKLGIRPEYLALAPAGAAATLPATVQKVQDIGTYFLVTLDAAGGRILLN